MNNTDATIQRLLEANPIREPVLRSVIQALDLPPGSRGLDVGCGIGLQAQLLAEAVGPEGYVTGLDIDPGLLAYGEMLAREAGFSGRVAFRQGSMLERLPFETGAFDWAWSADCVGYPLGDLTPVLEELKRIVRPGGSIYLLGWTSQQVLPGYPLLEARLNAACSSYTPYLQGKPAGMHFLRAPDQLLKAGLEQVQGQTFVGEVRAPLAETERAALISLVEMLWVEPSPGENRDDWNEVQRLCRPGSPDFILDQPGYYAFFTYTLFRGKVPGGVKENGLDLLIPK
jgi:demethylmenaquinone methyltransferase/2-methoxy-6-polyprenyl-1,4-benzoquinol methylase